MGRSRLHDFSMSIPAPRLAGKFALVTGGGSGIGRAIAIRLAEDGAHVTVVEERMEAGDDTASQIRDAGGVAEVVTGDVSNTDSMRMAFEQVDKLHILVNNAGISHVGNVLNTTPEDLDRVY